MARKCIFCGAAANSREDAWPRWLTSRYGAPGWMETERGPDLQMKTWPTNRAEIRIKRVCSSCNNGWMSRLEERAKPVIERLLDHEASALDHENSRTLALWAIKTAMVLQTLGQPESWIYSDLELTLMWHSQRMPDLAFVWIARCVNHSEAYAQHKSLWTGLDRQADPRDRAGVTTMAFGNLAVQVLKVAPVRPVPPTVEITFHQRPGPWGQLALRVWPLRTDVVRWPGPLAIGHEDGLEMFAERFSPEPPPELLT